MILAEEIALVEGEADPVNHHRGRKWTQVDTVKFDVGPMLYKWSTNVLCLLGSNK